MNKNRFTEEHIVFALKQAETGTRIEEIFSKMVSAMLLFTNGAKNIVA